MKLFWIIAAFAAVSDAGVMSKHEAEAEAAPFAAGEPELGAK